MVGPPGRAHRDRATPSCWNCRWTETRWRYWPQDTASIPELLPIRTDGRLARLLRPGLRRGEATGPRWYAHVRHRRPALRGRAPVELRVPVELRAVRFP